MNVCWKTIGPQPISVEGSSEEVLEEALAASAPMRGFLKRAVESEEPILLCVNDAHRSTQTNPALRALASLLKQMGSHRAGSKTGQRWSPRFRALIATGTHVFDDDDRRAFEKTTFAECGLCLDDIAWHDATDVHKLACIGQVNMHRWIAESRFLLPVGSVEPHYFGGATGPHKTLAIGCLSRAGIEDNHAGALSPSSDILRLRGNPVYDGMAEILRQLFDDGKEISAIGEVVYKNAVVAAEVGDPIDVTDRLLPTAKQIYVQTVDRPADVLRLRVPPPLGRSLYQADKALKNNHLAVRDGGGILLEADCPEGVGPNAFIKLLRRSSSYLGATELVARGGYRLGDHKAVKLRHLMDSVFRDVRVALVSTNLSPTELQDTGLNVFTSPEPALQWLAASVTGPIVNGLVVEDAGMVCLIPQPA